MKYLRRVLSMLLIISAMLSIISVPAFAEKTVIKYKKITDGKTFKVEDDYYTDINDEEVIVQFVYKYTVNTESLVKVNYDYSWLDVNVFRDKALKKKYSSFEFENNGSQVRICV